MAGRHTIKRAPVTSRDTREPELGRRKGSPAPPNQRDIGGGLCEVIGGAGDAISGREGMLRSLTRTLLAGIVYFLLVELLYGSR